MLQQKAVVTGSYGVERYDQNYNLNFVKYFTRIFVLNNDGTLEGQAESFEDAKLSLAKQLFAELATQFAAKYPDNVHLINYDQQTLIDVLATFKIFSVVKWVE